MSGRIRTLKPEWLDDERLALASSDARVLSVALLLLADDYGNGRAAPTLLAGRIFPGKVPETLARALAEIEGWFVELYEADGQRYFHIRNWAKHQKVDKPGKPRVPPPFGTRANLPEGPANLPETLAPDHYHDQDHDQEGTTTTTSDADAEPSPPRPAVASAQPAPVWEERSTATPCPTDLPEKLIAKGVHVELAQHLRADVESIVHELKKFRDFWVVGRNAGQSRSFWAGKARQWVIDQAAQNKLTPPGAIEHGEAQTSHGKARVDAVYAEVMAEAGGVR